MLFRPAGSMLSRDSGNRVGVGVNRFTSRFTSATNMLSTSSEWKCKTSQSTVSPEDIRCFDPFIFDLFLLGFPSLTLESQKIVFDQQLIKRPGHYLRHHDIDSRDIKVHVP
jgi:hypothetical protein